MKKTLNENFIIETRYSTFKRYQENYESDVKKYLDEYEENTEIALLKKDLASHKEVLKHLLTKTPDYIVKDEGVINQQRINSQKLIIEFIKKRILVIKGKENTKTAVTSEFVFKNNFDNVGENTIIEYFRTNLVEKKYISETVLNEFIGLAFDKKTEPAQKFSLEKLNTQNVIVQIFYDYYKITAGKPYGRQKEYLNLLCNYFNGFEDFNIKNFSK
jgi:hypothetical protein